jgi:hypothetical protein
MAKHPRWLSIPVAVRWASSTGFSAVNSDRVIDGFLTLSLNKHPAYLFAAAMTLSLGAYAPGPDMRGA